MIEIKKNYEAAAEKYKEFSKYQLKSLNPLLNTLVIFEDAFGRNAEMFRN